MGCALMVHHGFDKIQNVDGFSANVVAKFFGFLPGPPQFWTLSAAFTQIIGSGLEGFPLAVIPAHSYNFELASMYVAVLAYFSVAGAGAYSVDNLVLGGELNFYEGLIGKVFGGDNNDEE